MQVNVYEASGRLHAARIHLSEIGDDLDTIETARAGTAGALRLATMSPHGAPHCRGRSIAALREVQQIRAAGKAHIPALRCWRNSAAV